jgi:drug/metabolite transporter (DMT)-like permease
MTESSAPRGTDDRLSSSVSPRLSSSSKALKTFLCAAIVVLSNAFGDFFMKRGLPDTARLNTPLEYVTMLFQPWVTLGVLLLVVWQLSRMVLLSWADLSYVLPVTSIGYVIVALIGRVFLNESISPTRWAGILLIMGGVALVSAGTSPSTTSQERKP